MTSTPLITSEVDARRWIAEEVAVSRETLEKLDCLAALVRSEAANQNLVARSTLDTLWQRHFLDSAQLLRFAAPKTGEHWLDLGTGAGFPGLVIALLASCRMTLVESRGLRIAYLQRAVALLDLADRVAIIGQRLETIETFAADYISARAFAPLDKLLELSARFSTENTIWLLPKGQSGRKELESLPTLWHDAFHVEHSLTDADASILIGKGRVVIDRIGKLPGQVSELSPRQPSLRKRKKFRQSGGRQQGPS